MVQAAAIAYAIFGLSKHIDDGAIVDKASQESGATFEGVLGFIVHGINGEMVIPLLALILLIVSFFAKVRGGVMFAGVILGLIVVQVLLGIFGHELPALGALHGLNALAIFVMAFLAGQRARATSMPDPAVTAERSSV